MKQFSLPVENQTKVKKVENLPQTVERALDILEIFARSETALGIKEISERTGLNKSTAYRIVQALSRRGYVDQNERTAQYRLGSRLLRIASEHLNTLKLREKARRHLELLAKATSQTVQLALIDGSKVVYIDQVDGEDIFRIRLEIGTVAPLHCTAAGKCFLAYLGQEKLEDYLRKASLESFTRKTITSRTRLIRELKGVRKNGYSFCDGEYHRDVRAVGAPIFGMDGNVTGSVVLTIPAVRMKTQEVAAYGKLVREAALRITEEIGGVSKIA